MDKHAFSIIRRRGRRRRTALIYLIFVIIIKKCSTIYSIVSWRVSVPILYYMKKLVISVGSIIEVQLFLQQIEKCNVFFFLDCVYYKT